MKLRFYTLLGVTTPAAAAQRWPIDLVRPYVGTPRHQDFAEFEDLMIQLQDSLEFRAVRPGADADRTGLSAELFVTPTPIPVPLVLDPIRELAFYLKPTGSVPAMVYATRGRTGLEIAIQGLPVEIHFPAGMIQPIYTKAELDAADFDPPDKRLTADTAPFDPDAPDSVEIIASDSDATRVSVRINVRLTETGDFLFDTVVPISIGPCKLSGLPCRGLHDIQLIPSPQPTHVDSQHRVHEIALEWARRKISIADTDAAMPGLISIRTVDFDQRVEPFKSLFKKMHAKRAESDPVELVLEDVVLPFRTAPPLPIPTHGRISLRRSAVLGDTAVEAYNLHSTPVELDVRGTLFKIFRLMLQVPPEGESFVAVDMAWIDAEDPGSGVPPSTPWTLTATEQGEILLGTLLEQPKTFLTLLGHVVQLSAVKFGVSLKKIADVGRVESFVDGLALFTDFIALLGDFIILTPEQAQKKELFELRDETGKPTARILHDVGWAFGGPSLGSFYDPSKLRLVLANRVRLEIDELGLVGENNGGLYLMVSASLLIPLGESTGPDDATSPDTQNTASTDDSKRKGFGFRLHRLRMRLGRATDNQPRWLLDGASLFIRKGAFELAGFGMHSEYDRPPGNHFEESGIELKVRAKLWSKTIDFGGQFLHGSVSGVDNFTYLMIGFSIGGIPLGATRLLNVQILYANNMMPRLEPPDAQGQHMRLFRWFKANGNALTLPLDRKLTAWTPQDDASAIGVGLALTLAATSVVRFEGFFFYHQGGGEQGILAGFEVYFTKSEKPIAFAVVEWDLEHDKFGLMVGFSLGLENLLGEHLPSFLGNLAALTGSLYYARNPDILAIGQYNDQSTWLQFTFRFGGEKLNFGIFVGFCFHRVNEPDAADPTKERINVWALALTLKGGGKIKILGKLQVYATAVLVVGQWRNEGMATGHQFLFEAGVRCKVFGCFNFGAHIKVDTAALGPGEPKYVRKSTTFRIETPWYLPDVTFRWESTEGTAVPEAMEVVSLPMDSASARRPVGPREIAPIGVAGLDGDLGSGPVYELRRLRNATPHQPTEAEFAALRPIGVDSELMFDLAASCDAAATVLPSTTPTGGGSQASGSLDARYEIIEVGIRRRRRFGDGTWHDLIDPITTNLDSLAGLSQAELEARFHPAVRFDWDPDLHRVDRVDPRRLLVNADTPYSFFPSNPEGDEVVVVNQPGWPCCRPPRRPLTWHIVEFHDTPLGVRTPRVERFTRSESTLHWVGAPSPVVVPPIHAPSSTNVVIVRIGPRAAGVIAVCTFDEPVAVCQVFTYWPAAHSQTRLILEAYNGLAIVDTREFAMSVASAIPVTLTPSAGMTSLLLRRSGDVETPTFDPGPAVELAMIRYRTVREVTTAMADGYRCGAQDDQALGQGRLAWLPNTDYEVTLKTRVTLGYSSTGDQDGVVVQKAYFRTKGLVGLNAVARVGEEVDPYVESTYPIGADFLYRREPLAVAFNEKFNTLVPVDRTPAPGDPEERQQLLEWVLAIERVGGAEGLERISQTSPDWIVAHRPSGPSPTLPGRRPAVIDATLFSTPLRSALTTDPYRMRFENMLARAEGCATPPMPHTSQVLVHQPVDPGVPDAEQPRWERSREYRVNLRQKSGPFVERRPFEPLDAGAFVRQAESGSAVPWTSADGVMRPSMIPTSGAAQWALFGDPIGWERVRIRAFVDPQGGAAGVAVAVTGAAANRAVCALIDETTPERRLRLIERRDGTSTELGSATLPDDLPKPYVLEVTAYDDRVRAQVGEFVVEPLTDRGDLRSGRLALVANGGGAFHGLAVTALDAWRCHFRSSRYDDFEAHLASFRGTVGILEEGVAGAPMSSVAALLAFEPGRFETAMQPKADSEARERLFMEWIVALALPLREAPEALEVTRYGVADGTHLLLIESPEPLPFSRDVTLQLRRRMKPQPWPPHRPPLGDVGVFLASLEENDEKLIGDALPSSLRALRQIVRAEETRDGLVYHVYALSKRRARAMTSASRRTLRAASAPPGFAAIAPNEIGFFDAHGQPLLPPIESPSPQFYVDVATRILTNGDERRALVIPVGATLTTLSPMVAGTYRLIFEIDRPRWRSATADASTNYRASHMLTVAW